jgi:hypothetical protein
VKCEKGEVPVRIDRNNDSISDVIRRLYEQYEVKVDCMSFGYQPLMNSTKVARLQLHGGTLLAGPPPMPPRGRHSASHARARVPEKK